MDVTLPSQSKTDHDRTVLARQIETTERQIDALYECKFCMAGPGCKKSITSDGFDPSDCTLTGPFQTDCDLDGDFEWWQRMECSSTTYDWVFACGDCPE